MSGPVWECPPESLGNGRIVYRCMVGRFHSYAGAAWSCDGQPSRKSDERDERTSRVDSGES